MDYFNLLDVLSVLTRTVGIFVFTLILLRLLGKRHLSHLTYLDLLLVISMGSAVGDVMIYDEGTAQLVSSLVALTTIALLVKLLSRWSAASPAVNRLVTGTARVVVNNGKLLEHELRKEEMTKDELLTLLREKGFDEISDTKRVFIEPDGEVSIVPK
jgi:uncharacterized membrane protein YcaP (DUF421 family)